MLLDDFSTIEENFPFLSGLKHQDVEYIGIIQNSDDKILSFYNYEDIRTTEEKKLFLELGNTWWWESNRMLPINIFLRGDMDSFRYCLKTAVWKEVEILFGPVTSLNNIIQKRIKRRQIQLVRKVKD